MLPVHCFSSSPKFLDPLLHLKCYCTFQLFGNLEFGTFLTYIMFLQIHIFVDRNFFNVIFIQHQKFCVAFGQVYAIFVTFKPLFSHHKFKRLKNLKYLIDAAEYFFFEKVNTHILPFDLGEPGMSEVRRYDSCINHPAPSL